MIDLSRKILINNWLQNKLINHENGLILDDRDFNCFPLIQDFLAANDHPLKTTAIYYEAFPEESATEFIDLLQEEIMAKLGSTEVNHQKPLPEILMEAGLKMVIIDRCYLHPQDTLNNLLEQLSNCNVCLILIGLYDQMKLAQIIDHPTICQWDRFSVNSHCESLSQVF
ncbi:MAG: hypothetical protein AAFQ80_19575 [Cyanobacteria bacterium J06621_8]